MRADRLYRVVKPGASLTGAVVVRVAGIRKLCVNVGLRRFTVRVVPSDSHLRTVYPLTRWTRLFWYVVRTSPAFDGCSAFGQGAGS